MFDINKMVKEAQKGNIDGMMRNMEKELKKANSITNSAIQALSFPKDKVFIKDKSKVVAVCGGFSEDDITNEKYEVVVLVLESGIELVLGSYTQEEVIKML